MAADTYIRSSITHLQSGIADMQNQINSLQQQTSQQKQQLQQDIQLLEKERNGHQLSIPKMEDASQKHLIEDRVNKINHECDAKRAQMAQLDLELNAVVQRKNKALVDMQNLAHQLDVMTASPDIR